MPFSIPNIQLQTEDDEDGEDDDIVRGPQFVQVGIPSRKRLREAFVEQPKPRYKCFGCIYKEGDKTGELPKRRLDALMKKLTSCIGQTDEICLFKEAADDYAKIRRDVNSRLRPGQKKLPSWNAASIAEHM